LARSKKCALKKPKRVKRTMNPGKGIRKGKVGKKKEKKKSTSREGSESSDLGEKNGKGESKAFEGNKSWLWWAARRGRNRRRIGRTGRGREKSGTKREEARKRKEQGFRDRKGFPPYKTLAFGGENKV